VLGSQISVLLAVELAKTDPRSAFIHVERAVMLTPEWGPAFLAGALIEEAMGQSDAALQGLQSLNG